MILIPEERDARDNNSLLIGVSHVGHDKLTGSIVSCAVCLDYTKITQQLIDGASKGYFEGGLDAASRSAVKLFNLCKLDAVKLNDIADTNIACKYADFHALYRCVFNFFDKFSSDPDSVISSEKICEVIKNPDLSLYTNKNSRSGYVVLKDWNQFENLIPNTKFSIVDQNSTFTLLFAKAFANTILRSETAEQKAKYPEYEFGYSELPENQKTVLKEKGLTEFHRAYLPEFSEYAFSPNILI